MEVSTPQVAQGSSVVVTTPGASFSFMAPNPILLARRVALDREHISANANKKTRTQTHKRKGVVLRLKVRSTPDKTSVSRFRT